MLIRVNYFEGCLNKYQESGFFQLESRDFGKLSEVCNAPKDRAGIYLIFDITGLNELIYVGCSGRINNNGRLAVRKSGGGGIYGRIVNGNQFGAKRIISFPQKFASEKIEKVQIDWYVTFNDEIRHSPIFTESIILQSFFDEHKILPRWNQKF